MTVTPPTFAPAEFRKSRRSQPDRDCVYVAARAGWVAVRDGKVAFTPNADDQLILPATAFTALASRLA